MKFNWAFGHLNTSQFTKKPVFSSPLFRKLWKKHTFKKYRFTARSFYTKNVYFVCIRAFIVQTVGKCAKLRVHRDVSRRDAQVVWGHACLAQRPWILWSSMTGRSPFKRTSFGRNFSRRKNSQLRKLTHKMIRYLVSKQSDFKWKCDCGWRAEIYDPPQLQRFAMNFVKYDKCLTAFQRHNGWPETFQS